MRETRITRHLYKRMVTATGVRVEPQPSVRWTHEADRKVYVRIVKVTNKGWPYPPKVGDHTWWRL